jgi:hypothetical protein
MAPHTDVSSDNAFDLIRGAHKVFMEIDKGKRLSARP